MINFRPRPFIRFTPIESGITFVDLGELHEDASHGVEVPRDRSTSLPPISAPRLHNMGEGRHGSLPPMTPTSNLEAEENAQGVREIGSDGSDTTSSQGEPDNSEVPLRNSQVSKAK
jgi:hypothetical protein